MSDAPDREESAEPQVDTSALDKVVEISGRKRRSLKWYVIGAVHVSLFAVAVFYLGRDLRASWCPSSPSRILSWVCSGAGGDWEWSTMEQVMPLEWTETGRPRTDELMVKVFEFINRVHVSILALVMIGVVSIFNIWAVATRNWWRRMGGWGAIFKRRRRA